MSGQELSACSQVWTGAGKTMVSAPPIHSKLKSSVILKEEHTCTQSCEKKEGGDNGLRPKGEATGVVWHKETCPESLLHPQGV